MVLQLYPKVNDKVAKNGFTINAIISKSIENISSKVDTTVFKAGSSIVLKFHFDISLTECEITRLRALMTGRAGLGRAVLGRVGSGRLTGSSRFSIKWSK